MDGRILRDFADVVIFAPSPLFMLASVLRATHYRETDIGKETGTMGL